LKLRLTGTRSSASGGPRIGVEAATIETLRQAVERSFPELAGLTLKRGPEEEAVLAQLATEGEGRGAETARHLRV
jgi:hypothetical protein